MNLRGKVGGVLTGRFVGVGKVGMKQQNGEMCVCVCKHLHMYIHVYLYYIHMFIYIYIIYLCICPSILVEVKSSLIFSRIYNWSWHRPLKLSTWM